MGKHKFSITKNPGGGKPLQELSGPLWPGGPTAEKMLEVSEKMFRDLPKKTPEEIKAELNQLEDFVGFMTEHPDVKPVEGTPGEYSANRPVHELLGEYQRTRKPRH